MAAEILAVNEADLLEVITVIRAGLAVVALSAISEATRDRLLIWCDDQEEYMRGAAS